MTTEEKRLFIGGLVKGVTEEELVEKFSRFGGVSNVEIKTRTTDADSKTFAYLNLTAEDSAFKKCFTAYNNTKWKGGQLTLQFAKESFLSKLRKEQAEANMSQEKGKSKPASVHKSPALDSDRKAVPGTPMDDKGTWVMGKYSRVLPVLNVRKPGTRKIVTLDPSKMTQSLKKLKDDDFDPAKHSDLTWQLEENTSEINKLRQGKFPAWEAPKYQSTPKDVSAGKQESIFSRLQAMVAEQQVSDTEMEVVPAGGTGPVSRILAHSGYGSDDSAGSADTDEIVSKASVKNMSTLTAKKSPSAKDANMKKKKSKKESTVRVDFPFDKGSAREDSEDKSVEIKNPRMVDKTKEASRTPEFKGLGVLSSDSEDEAPPPRPTTGSGSNKLQSNGKDTIPAAKRAKGVRSPLEKKKTQTEKSPAPEDVHSYSQKQQRKKLVHSSENPKTVLHSVRNKSAMTAEKSNGSVGLLAREDISEFESGLVTDSSCPPPEKKQKRVKQVSSEDSDLDDNDFEKVAKKLAARAQQRERRTFDKGQQGTTRKTSQDEKEHLTSMQKSHQAYRKNQQDVRKKENLVTKTLREGTGSKCIQFSDSEEEVASEAKPPKMSLFSDSDDDSDSVVDFSLRPQFEGSKGKKLFELQSRLTDKRFHFDECFQSESENDETTELQQEPQDEMTEEKKRNLDILEKVLGYKPRQRARHVYEGMSKRRYNPDSVSDPATAAKPAKRRKLDNNQQRTTEVGDSKQDSTPDDGEEDRQEDSVSDHIEQDVEGLSDSEEEADLDGDGGSSSNHTEQDTEEGSGSEGGSGSEEGSGSEDSPHSTEEDSGAEGKEQDDGDDSSKVSSTEQGKGLKDLFSGGSSFSFFGTPDAEDDESESETVTVSKRGKVEDEEEKSEEEDEDDSSEEDEDDNSKEDEDDKENGDEMEDEDDDTEEASPNENSVPESDRPRPPVRQQPSFMVASDDPRLTAAVRFFKRPHEEDFQELSERWPEERQKIMQLVRDRHKKACRKERQMKQELKPGTFVKTKVRTSAKTKKWR